MLIWMLRKKGNCKYSMTGVLREDVCFRNLCQGCYMKQVLSRKFGFGVGGVNGGNSSKSHPIHIYIYMYQVPRGSGKLLTGHFSEKL